MTRWAGFWLITTPFGQILFLLMSGPTPGLRAPRDLNRGLSGGWAFLLSLVLSSALPVWWWS